MTILKGHSPKNNPLKFFFLAYFMFFICLCLVLIPAYFLFYNSYVKNTLEKNEQVLKNGLLGIENDLSAFRGVCMSFFDTADASTIFFYLPPLADTQVYRLGKVDSNFTNAMRYISSREDVGYILPGRIILSYDRLYNQAADMYGKYLKFLQYETFDQWFAALTDFEGSFRLMPEQMIVNDKRAYSGITCILRLPLNAKQNNHIIYMTIDSSNLIEKLLLPEVLASSTLDILNRNGEILLSREGDSGENYAYISAESHLYNFTVRVGINRTLFVQKMEPFTRLGLIFTSLYILMGIVCTLIFSWQSSRPLNALAEELTRQTDQIHYHMISCILNNQIYDENTYINASEYMKNFSGLERYRIGLLELNFENQPNIPSLTAQRMIAVSLIRSFLGEDIITHAFQNNIVTIIPQNTPNNYNNPEKMIDLISSTLLVSCRLFLSKQYSGMENISRAYARVRTLSRIREAGSDQTVLYDDDHLSGDESSRYNEAINAQRLYELLIRTKEEAACMLLDETCENIRKSNLVDEEYVRSIFYSYLYIFIKVRTDLRIAKLFDFSLPPYDVQSPIPMLFTKLKEVVSSWCAILREEHSEADKRHEKEILQYVDENFSNPNVYIRSVIDRFKISENTLQRVIRNATGHSFFDYLDQKRLEYAYTMIKTTNRPLTEIITACGYTSQNTFYKAFKRRFNMPPSAVRQI
jgi:AraC-like DNA-binding protein